MNPKQRVAEAVLEYVQSGTIVGLGSGSTSDAFIQALGAAVKAGRFSNLKCICSSINSERRAAHLGLTVTTFAEHPRCAIYVDGADEVGPNLTLIKGLGGALLREKICAQNSDQFIVIADSSKRVTKMGTRSPVPVEVTQFAHEATASFLKSLGSNPVLRKTPEGTAFITDNSNYIYDCHFSGIDDPERLDTIIKDRAGVVETGLFVNIATMALIADENRVERLTK
jgi:ribose 5-phosphate isomerase A